MNLNIGGQKGRKKGPFESWTVVDVREGAEIVMDVMKDPLPLVDNSVDAIYTSHTLEHIFPDVLPFVLSECYRVLKPNCAMRVVVPDLDIAIKAYTCDKKFLADKRNPRKIDHLPNYPLCYLSSWFFTYDYRADGPARLTGGHVMAFNWEVLRHYLQEAGFGEINQKTYNDCRSEFVGCDFDRYRDCSLYVEAIKD